VKEKITIAMIGALVGGTFNSVLEARTTAGQLQGMQESIKRIEARLDALHAPRVSGDRQ